MRIVFCGSGEVATATLEALCAAGHEIAMVVTQPPRKAGRGGEMQPTPVAHCVAALGIEAQPCEDINDAAWVQRIAAAQPELIAVVDFGQKVGESVRRLAGLGAINMHASLLPALRGAAPINWAIIRGMTETGVTTFRLADKMDAGPILLQEPVAGEPTETAEELRERLAAAGAQLVLRTVDGLAAGTITETAQDEQAATRARKLTKQDGEIDFAAGAIAVVNRIRGTWPWPGAHADFVGGGHKPVRVIFARANAMLTGDANPARPGTLADDLTINVPDGAVEIVELKVAGKRLMGWRDFVNGYRVAAGDRFVAVGGASHG